MHSNGEELHPNWRALATVHLPLKRFIRAADEIGGASAGTVAEKHEILGLHGEEAQKFYEEVLAEEASSTTKRLKVPTKSIRNWTPDSCANVKSMQPFERIKFYRCAQQNDTKGLRNFALHADNVNCIDEFGWTALMVAACEGARNAVKTLLSLGADKTIRDKTGKNAQDLARKKGHIEIVKILQNDWPSLSTTEHVSSEKVKESQLNVPFFCDVCQQSFTETTLSAHQTSTVHQFNVKSAMPTNKLERFNIPNRNRGLQLMVKQGWDRESGLGPTQNGRLYPVKTVIRNKRTGLGIEQTPARVTHFEAFDLRATQRRAADYHTKNRNRNDIRREKVRDWKRTRRLRNELS